MKSIIIASLLICVLALIGCHNHHNPQGRVGVSGEITLDGTPLMFGNVSFESDPNASPLVQTGCPIKQGTFFLPMEHGLIPDQEYTVRFSALKIEPLPPGADPMTTEAKTKQLIPDRYRQKSQEKVTATKKSPNKLKFELSSR